MTRVLVVDDEVAIRESLTLILEDAGFEVVQASDGRVALMLAEDVLPDLILSDWTMPGMGGEGLMRGLRANQKLRNIPIVIMTASAPLTGPRPATFIQKPFRGPVLLEHIQKALHPLLRKKAPNRLIE